MNVRMSTIRVSPQFLRTDEEGKSNLWKENRDEEPPI